MTVFKFTENTDVVSFLKEHHRDKAEPPFVVIYEKEGDWYFEAYKEQAIKDGAYILSEDDFLSFLDRSKPSATYSASEKETLDAAISLAIKELRSINSDEIKKEFQKRKARAEKEKNPKPRPDYFEEAVISVAEKIGKSDNIRDKIIEPALASLCDALWMTQGLATDALLKSSGSSNARILASAKQIGGVVFGASINIVAGVLCGILSAKIHEKRAIKKYIEQYKKPPTDRALKFIQQDAKLFGYSVFGSMSGWAIGAGIMQGAFYVARTMAGFTPHGLIVNIAISIAAGIGQSIISSIAFYRAEKSRFHTESGEFNKEEWKKRKNSTEFKKGLIKNAVSAFIAGFAWNMIGVYLPVPAQDALKNGALIAKKAIGVAITAGVSGISTFLSFCATSVAPVLFSRVKNLFFQKKENQKMRDSERLPLNQSFNTHPSNQ